MSWKLHLSTERGPVRVQLAVGFRRHIMARSRNGLQNTF